MMGRIARRRFLAIAPLGVLGGTVAAVQWIQDRREPTFGTDRAFVTMNGNRVGPETHSDARARAIAKWLNAGGARALGS